MNRPSDPETGWLPKKGVCAGICPWAGNCLFLLFWTWCSDVSCFSSRCKVKHLSVSRQRAPLDLFDDIEGLCDKAFDEGVAIPGSRSLYAVDDYGAEAEAGMAEQSAETIDAGGLHFEVGDAMGAVGKAGEAVDEFRLAEAETQHAALGAIKARAGNGDALVEAGGEMTEQGGAGAADIGVGQAMVQLGLGGKRLEQLVLGFVGLVAIEVEEVVDAKAVGRGHEAVCGYIFL